MSIEFIDLKAQYKALRTSINARIQKVLDHGQCILGPEVAELEHRLAEYTGARYCITCASGTEALLISLMALGIGRGDEVITSPFTFVSTAEVIILVGATPVFVDVEPDTCNIDPGRIAAAITPRTRALLPVSLYGQPADMDAINAIAAQYGLPVIEDAAQSFGAEYKGRKSGNLSTIGCTSFFPSKPLGCYGDGGAIFTHDEVLARTMREIRVHGQERRYHHTRIGVGGRMDTLQCAVVLAMERFDWEIGRRLAIGVAYLDALQGNKEITLPTIRPDRSCVFAQFTLQVAERPAFVQALRNAGVPTAVHYPLPLHRQPAYRGVVICSGSLTNAETLAERVVSLPMHPYLEPATQAMIVTAVKTATGSA